MIQKTSLRDQIANKLDDFAGKTIDAGAEEDDAKSITQEKLADAIATVVFETIVEDSKDDIHRLIFAKKR